MTRSASKRSTPTDLSIAYLRGAAANIASLATKISVVADQMENEERPSLPILHQSSLLGGLGKIKTFADACEDAIQAARMPDPAATPSKDPGSEKPKTPRKGKR